MTLWNTRRFGLLAATILLVLAPIGTARGGETWDGGSPTNNFWSTAANWNPDGVPANDGGANIVFAGTTRLDPNADIPWDMMSLSFGASAGAFNISGQTLSIHSGGIANNSTSNQAILNNINLMDPQMVAANNASGLTLSGTVSLGGNELTVQGSGSVTLGGVIQGNGSLLKLGNNILSLTGSSANTYTGTTTVRDGTLILARSGGDRTIVGDLIIGDGGPSAIVQLGFSDQITQAVGRSVTVHANGMLDTAGNSDTINDLVLVGGRVGTSGGVLTIQGGVTTLASGSMANVSGNIGLGGGTRVFTLADGPAFNDLDMTASISSGSLTKAGPGTLRFSGSTNNTYSGLTTVNEGTLVLSRTFLNGAIAGSLLIGDGIGGAGADVVRYEAAEQIADTSGVTILSSGLLNLNNYSDAIVSLTMTGGSVTTGAGALSVIGPITTNAHSASATISGYLDLSAATKTFDVADGAAPYDLDVTACVLGAGILKTGDGALRLGGSSINTVTGQTEVQRGTLYLGKSSGNAIGGSLYIHGSGGYASVILEADNQLPDTAEGDVWVGPSGVLDLAGHNETIPSLQMGGGDVQTGAGTLTVASSIRTNTTAGSSTISGHIAFGDPAGEFYIESLPLVVNASIGGGSLRKYGYGTLTLAGPGTFAGGLECRDGTLVVDHDAALGTGALTLSNNSTLDAQAGARILANDVTVLGMPNINAAQPLTFNGSVTLTGDLDVRGATVTFSQGVNGPGGLSKNGADWLTLGADSRIDRVFLGDGTLAVTTLTTSPSGTFTQTGGTFLGTLRSRGWFDWQAGTFAGRLINEGSYGESAFAAGNGVQNLSNLGLSTGGSLTSNGAGLDNQGTITLWGGTLDGNGPLTNNGLLFGNGTIAGTGGFTNNLSLLVQGGILTIANTGVNSNTGTIDLLGGSQLQITGSGLGNTGAILLDASAIVIDSTLTNNAGGTVRGNGSVVGEFVNDGTALADGGTLNFAGPVVNRGEVRVMAGATVAGGLMDNTGLVAGRGTVANAIDNLGRIDTDDGTLTLTGAVTNLAGGVISAPAGGKVIVKNMATNAGEIDLTGGAAEFSRALTNAAGGVIGGRGTLRVGQTGLTNLGSVAFSAGLTDVYGDVANATGGRIIVSGGGTATFWDDVVHNGAEIRTSAGCNSVFLGAVSGSGLYTGDGTTYFEGDLKPGSSPAAVTFGGNVNFTSTTALEMELGGTTPGSQYDTVTVASSFTIDGTLRVLLIDGFRPAHGNAFQILNWGTRVGTFDTITGLDLGSRLTLVPAYNATNMTLTAVQGGSAAWRTNASPPGNWSVPDNWTGGVPNGSDDVATFGSVITAPQVVTADGPITVGGIVFDSTVAYTVGGTNFVTLQTPSGDAWVTVTGASAGANHTISAPVLLESPLTIANDGAGLLAFVGPLHNPGGKTITKRGPGGAVTIAGPQIHGPGAALAVSRGTVNLNSDAGAPGFANLAVTVSVGAVINFRSTQHLASLDLVTGSSQITAGGTRTLVTGALTIDATDSVLDLTDNNLIVDWADGGTNPAFTIQDRIRTGYNVAGGYWDGLGITSSTAATADWDGDGSPDLLTAVGVIDNTDWLIGGKAALDGVAVDASSVLVKFTYWGDMNFDGMVTFDDYDIIDYYYWFPLPPEQMGWWTGDLDYDGNVDFDDYDRIDYAYWFQGAPLMGGGLGAVPEPATLALVALGGLGALLRRRE